VRPLVEPYVTRWRSRIYTVALGKFGIRNTTASLCAGPVFFIFMYYFANVQITILQGLAAGCKEAALAVPRGAGTSAHPPSNTNKSVSNPTVTRSVADPDPLVRGMDPDPSIIMQK
jgi:hypothetical protein